MQQARGKVWEPAFCRKGWHSRGAESELCGAAGVGWSHTLTLAGLFAHHPKSPLACYKSKTSPLLSSWMSGLSQPLVPVQNPAWCQPHRGDEELGLYLRCLWCRLCQPVGLAVVLFRRKSPFCGQRVLVF